MSFVIRRSFRIGLWLGLLAGAGFALAKIFRPKREQSSVLDLGTGSTSFGSARTEWPPLEAAITTPTPVAVPGPEVEPVVATDEPGLVTIGDEPLMEPEPVADIAPASPAPAPAPTPTPAPAPEPEHVAKPVAKKPAAKKPAAPKPAAPAKKTPAKKKAAPVAKVKAAWVDPQGNICPQTHPVKAKMASKIFQVPGNFAYARTNPDRCYVSAEAAVADGLRPAKR